MYAARRSGLKRERFGYVDGGYQSVLRAFRARLEDLGVRTLAGRPVTRVRDHGDRVTLDDVHYDIKGISWGEKRRDEAFLICERGGNTG